MFEQWILENGETVQVALFFILFAIFGLTEWIAPKRKGSIDRRERWPANLILTVVNIAFLSTLPVTFLDAAMRAKESSVGFLNLATLPWIVAFIATLLLRGFISWFTHLLMHKVPFLWRFHRTHHLDTELDVTTTVRFHPVEFGLSLIIGFPLVYGFGLSITGLLIYEVLDAAVTLFSHANVSLPRRIEIIVRYLIVTPDLHRVHHSAWQPETDSNFSAVFPIWDVVFGTFRTETREDPAVMALGLEDIRDERTNQLGWLLREPFLRHTSAPNLEESST